MNDKLEKALRKALSTTAGSGGDFLPTPLAQQFITFVRDVNFARQLFRVITMQTKTLDIPKLLGGTKVYYQSTEGGTATETSMDTGTLQLAAKKFMAWLEITEEVREDAQGDFDGIVRQHFAEQLAAAEEEAMMVGDTAHTPTTAVEANATTTTWFNKDHRLIFDGLLTLSGDIAGSLTSETRAANRVNANSGSMTAALVREAMYNLGKYGRVMNDLVLILNPWSVNQLMDDTALRTVDKYGAGATIVTGEFGRLYGKSRVINSAYMTDTYGVLLHRNNVVIGDRRRVKLATDTEVKKDTVVHAISERMDFLVEHKPGLCQIHSLASPSTES